MTQLCTMNSILLIQELEEVLPQRLQCNHQLFLPGFLKSDDLIIEIRSDVYLNVSDDGKLQIPS